MNYLNRSFVGIGARARKGVGPDTKSTEPVTGEIKPVAGRTDISKADIDLTLVERGARVPKSALKKAKLLE